MYTFGYGKDGQLGHGDKENKTSPVLVQALEGKHITQVQCDGRHTMALTSSGYMFTWGYGHGNNSKLDSCSIPTSSRLQVVMSIALY
jgi:RCC1 and BTB domain-containing protein